MKIAIITATTAVTAASAVSAAVMVSTTGVYDELTTVNSVDRNAGSITAAQFTADVAAAFAADLGGVIDFDDAGFENNNTGPITADYGLTDSSTISITIPNTFNSQSSSTISQISGSDYFLNSSATDLTTTFGFDGQGVTQLGFTVLGRSSGVDSTVTAVATYSDLSMSSTLSADFTSDSTFATQDTFYGFAAPAGLTIDSVVINYTGTGDTRRGLDDLGFITVIPEPTSALAAAAGLGGLLLRRRTA
jgi:hypothetical protein